MSKMYESLDTLRFLDTLGEKKTYIHLIHPVTKIVTTLAFLICVVSFGKYEVSGLLPLMLFLMVVALMSDTPLLPILKRMLIGMPLILGIGIFNPLIDHKPLLMIGHFTLTGGWISFGSLVLKGFLTITVTLLLIATTGMNKIAEGLRILKLPKLFVVQLLLTYRYITVLIEEISRTTMAYSLRASQQRGIHIKDWGSLLGQLLNRTIDRASRIYSAMCVRGFKGEYHSGQRMTFKWRDFLFAIGWIAFFILTRLVNIPQFIGQIVTGAGL